MTECQAKRYKKNGDICGLLGCKNHFIYTPAATATAFANAALAPKFVAFLSEWIRPGALCYAALSPLLAVHRALTPDHLAQLLAYVYTKSVLAATAKDLRVPVGELPGFFFKCFALDTHHSSALRCLQRRWRAAREPGLAPSALPPSSPPSLPDYTNAEDPFTMEPIGSIPEALRWDYEDSHGHRYVFHAPSLDYFIKNQGAWNPYTREPIPEADLARLQDTIARLSPSDTPDFTVVWRTPRDAFADVLHDYERFGFYTDIQWFLGLTPHHIMRVYFMLSVNPFIAPLYFHFIPLEGSILQDPEHGAAFHMAREMQRLIRDTLDLKFYIVCNLFVALSKVSRPMRQALPPWVQMVGNAIDFE